MRTQNNQFLLRSVIASVAIVLSFGAGCSDDDPPATGDSEIVDPGRGGLTPLPEAQCQQKSDCATTFISLGVCEDYDCVSGACTVVPRQDGLNCALADLCTVNGQCSNGACVGTAKACNDDNLCTDDSCDPGSGDCLFVPNERVCDDGLFCTSDDRCNQGVCEGTADPLCQCETEADCAQLDDADLCNGVLTCVNNVCKPKAGSEVVCIQDGAAACEVMECDPLDGLCKAGPMVEGTSCDDGDACSKNDICWAGVCQGQDVICDDSNPCTDDSCDAQSGCVYEPNTASCDDGDLCTVNDACDAGTCVGGTTNEACDCAVDADCVSFEDGDLCNGTLVCVAGACTVDDSTVIDCAAAAAAGSTPECTTVACEPATGLCVAKTDLNGTACDDGNACTEEDYCLDANCVGLPITCSDKKACTEDSCDPSVGCTYAPLSGNSCGDYNACTTNDVCVDGVCVGTPDPSCQCDSDADCADLEDGDFCNGTLGCVDGECLVVEASIVDCASEFPDPCIVGVCEPSTGECSSQPLEEGASCDDGDACTQDEVCLEGSCQGGAIGCDDGNLCTDDACDSDVGCVCTYGDAL